MQTVGELLREEREKKGLSLKDIEAGISIRALYLNAIEEGNYHLVPGEVYLKGFIRNYANYLGLNGQQMINSYRQTQVPSPPVIANTTLDKDANKDVNKETNKDANKKMAEEPLKTNTKTNKWLLISLLAICVAGSAWWLLGGPPVAKEPQGNKQVQPTPSAPTEPLPIQSAVPAPPVKPKTVVMIAKYTELCWTSVTADGKNIYEGTPQTGETITWEAQKNMTITVGNAGGVDINLNGQPIGKLGGMGEVVIKTFVAQQ